MNGKRNSRSRWLQIQQKKWLLDWLQPSVEHRISLNQLKYNEIKLEEFFSSAIISHLDIYIS